MGAETELVSINRIPTKDLKLLWTLFQWFWPLVLNILGDEVYDSLPKLLAP